MVTSILLLGSTVFAVTLPSEGLKSSTGEILSEVSTFAGSGQFDMTNGSTSEAAFRTPENIAVLSDGSVVVSDSRNQVIRSIINNEVSTFAGFTLETNEFGYPLGGWNDGKVESALFNGPAGMAVDQSGNLYIADRYNHRIRKISTNGEVTTIAGGVIGSADGKGESAQFNQPHDIAVGQDGTIYVVDTLNHSIRKIAADGQVTTLNALSNRSVQVLEGSVEAAGDFADGKLAEAKFNEPTGIAVDGKGNLYISDSGNQVIRYIDLKAGMVTTVTGLGNKDSLSIYAEGALYAEGDYKDGAASEALFDFPKGIVITGEGGLIIADSLNHTIRYLFEGQVSTLAGDPGINHGRENGINGLNQLHHPTDVAILPNGNVLIADSYNHLIREINWYSLPSDMPQNNQVKVALGNEWLIMDTEPELVDGRTMVPVTALSEELGYEVEFLESSQTVTLTKDSITLQLEIGKSIISKSIVGSETLEIDIDVVPFISNARTYVPLRFISEELGLDVQWNEENRTVILREKGNE